MRISDWSSDVCSSDLYPATIRSPLRHCEERRDEALSSHRPCAARAGDCFAALAMTPTDASGIIADLIRVHSYERRNRSEEHTSELQSLMRISYAVFCLKKKKIILILPAIHTINY